jgi:excisionase family DNA binding protein
VSDLARALLEEIASDPAALERLRQLVSERPSGRDISLAAPAYTVATLAAVIGRKERSIRAAIRRGELAAVKRGRGYLIAPDAVAAWARPPAVPTTPRSPYQRHRRSDPGPATRALRGADTVSASTKRPRAAGTAEGMAQEVSAP